LARAVAARVLAAQHRRVAASEAFTYALLGSIGRLALVSVYPERYRQVLLTLSDSDPAELAEAERAVFEIDAELLSALMLRAWGLPAYHAALTAAASRDGDTTAHDAAILQTCRVGGLVARLLVAAHVTRHQIAAAMRAMAELGVGAESAGHLFPDIIANYEAAGSEMRIKTPSVPSLAEIYARAADAPRAGT
jgi:HD-like signal output (HDOD) protein